MNISNSIKCKITGIFSLNNNISVWLGTFIHSDTYRLRTRNKTRRVLQGILEQKLKTPSSPAPLSLYWKHHETSICIKQVSPRSPKIVFPTFRLLRLHLSNPERLLRNIFNSGIILTTYNTRSPGYTGATTWATWLSTHYRTIRTILHQWPAKRVCSNSSNPPPPPSYVHDDSP